MYGAKYIHAFASKFENFLSEGEQTSRTNLAQDECSRSYKHGTKDAMIYQAKVKSEQNWKAVHAITKATNLNCIG